MTKWMDMSFTPYPLAWLELKNGTQLKARYANCDWETMDGQWIKPSTIVRWMPLYVQALRVS